MKVTIKSLYGIKNSLELEFKNKAVVFAPNGVGKTSIAKGFKNFENHDILNQSMENDLDEESMLVDGKSFTSKLKVKVVDSLTIEGVLSNGENIIKQFIDLNHKSSEVSYGNLYSDYEKILLKVSKELNMQYKDLLMMGFEKENIDIDLIGKVNKIVKNTLNKYQPLDLKKLILESRHKLEDIQKLINSSKELTKGINVKEVASKVNVPSGAKRELDGNMISDIEILMLITSKQRDEKFRYVINENMIGIQEAKENLLKVLNKEGVAKDQVDNFLAIIELNKIISREKRALPQKADTIIKKAEKHIRDINLSLLNLILASHQKEFEITTENIKKNEIEFISLYNKYVDGINTKMLLAEKLNWKFTIKNIERYDEVPEVKIFDSFGIETEQQNLDEYASEGQKRILALLLSTLDSNYDLWVFDDPISSLDNDNAQIFVDLINDLDKKILLLTHNYRLLSLLSLTKGDFVFYAIDCQNIGQVKKIDLLSAGSNPAFINSWMKENVSKKFEIGKLLLLCTVAREVIDNYIFNGYSSGDSCFLHIKNSFESIARHWKSDSPTIANLKNNLYECKCDSKVTRNSEHSLEYKRIKKEFFSPNSVFEYIINFTNDSESINDYVLNFDPQNIEPNNFLEYLISKYILALKMRFLIERNLITQLPKSNIELWDNNKITGLKKLISSHKLKNSDELMKIYDSINYLNHVNNLRWTPVIEIPFYKLIKYVGDLLEKF